MRALASYIMRGRLHAIAAAVGFMGLSLIFPLFSYISAATVALVALRLGWRETFVVTGGALLATAAVTGIALGDPGVGASFALVVWAPIMVLALVLRQTLSLPITLAVAASLGALGVLAVYIGIDDPAGWWRDSVIKVIQTQVIDSAGLDAEQAETWRAALDRMASVMTGIVVAWFVLSSVLSLLLARWWQALLYNPGGFRKEFYQLRLGKTLAVIALAVMSVSLLPLDKVAAISKDIVIVLVLLYMLQGLAVVHAAVAVRRISAGWLVALYFVLLVVPMAVAIAGLLDTWVELRNRVRPTQS